MACVLMCIGQDTSDCCVAVQASASRGAFLIRLTAVFTPVVAAAQGQRPNRSVWAGCLLALAGGVLISTGGQAADAQARL